MKGKLKQIRDHYEEKLWRQQQKKPTKQGTNEQLRRMLTTVLQHASSDETRWNNRLLNHSRCLVRWFTADETTIFRQFRQDHLPLADYATNISATVRRRPSRKSRRGIAAAKQLALACRFSLASPLRTLSVAICKDSDDGELASGDLFARSTVGLTSSTPARPRRRRLWTAVPAVPAVPATLAAVASLPAIRALAQRPIVLFNHPCWPRPWRRPSRPASH